MHLLGLPLLDRQLWGVISIPFLGHWLCEARRHWEPLGATGNRWEPLALLFCHQPTLQLGPSISDAHPPSDVEQSSRIQTSPLTLGTGVPEEAGRDKERLFADCRREGKGGRFVKYGGEKRSLRNEEVLFCFIFDGGKPRSYTGLPL